MMQILNKKRHQERRSPLKAPPLRSAGQSLDEQIHLLVSEDAGPHVAMVVISSLIILQAWIYVRIGSDQAKSATDSGLGQK
jgi:hypothetical protein